MAKSGLHRITLKELEAETRRRRRTLDKLQNERERLASRLAEVDREIAEVTGEEPRSATATSPRRKKKKKTAKKASTGRGRRGGRAGSLPEMLVSVMSTTTPKRVRDLAAEVQKRGYRTQSANLPGLVSQALAKDARFRKVGRGQFVLAH